MTYDKAVNIPSMETVITPSAYSNTRFLIFLNCL